jgi:hypothetical protein
MSEQQFKSAALPARIPAVENDDSEDKRFNRSGIAQSDPSCLQDSKACTAVILKNLSARLVGHITTDYQDPITLCLNGRINNHLRMTLRKPKG